MVTSARLLGLLLIPTLVSCQWSNTLYEAEIPDLAATGKSDVQATVDSESTSSHSRLRVMTFNIHWEGHDVDGKYFDTGFVHRKPLVLDVLKKFDADIIGLQEASIEQRTAIAPELTAFGMFPLPAEDGDECILYRLDRFDMREAGHEYLRRKPEKAGTNIGVRDFVWVYLQDQISGERFYVLNLHLDHRSSQRGRELDGVLIGEWIKKRKFKDPVILTGDLNGTPEKPRYLYLTGQRAYPDGNGITVKMPMPMLDTYKVANPHAQYPGTTNSGYRGKKNGNQIDYVFVPSGAEVIDSKIIHYDANGSYPSDHFPLLSEFVLK